MNFSSTFPSSLFPLPSYHPFLPAHPVTIPIPETRKTIKWNNKYSKPICNSNKHRILFQVPSFAIQERRDGAYRRP